MATTISPGLLTLNTSATSQPPDKVFNGVPINVSGSSSGVLAKVTVVVPIEGMTFAIEIPQFSSGGLAGPTAQIHVTRTDSNTNWNVQLPIAVQLTFNQSLNPVTLQKKRYTYRVRLTRSIKAVRRPRPKTKKRAKK
jgi:hypothetical protein